MNGRKGKTLFILVLLVIMSMLVATVSALPTHDGITNRGADLELNPFEADAVSPIHSGGVLDEINGATGQALYIVMFDDPPLASYRGGIDGLEATNPATRGEAKVDVGSPAYDDYLKYLQGKHTAFLEALKSLINRSVEVAFDYYIAFNGMAVHLTPDEAAAAQELPGVAQSTCMGITRTSSWSYGGS